MLSGLFLSYSHLLFCYFKAQKNCFNFLIVMPCVCTAYAGILKDLR